MKSKIFFVVPMMMHPRRWLLLTCIILLKSLCSVSCFGPLPTSSQASFDPVAWLKKNAIKVDSIDLYSTHTFTDLNPLKEILDGVKIVFLGENTHGDGAGDRFKARLISFLHEELNFDTLVWEIGLFDGFQADGRLQLVSDSGYGSIFKDCMQNFWSNIEETKSIFEYLTENIKSSSNPAGLELQGYDVLGTNISGAGEQLISFLVSALPSDLVSSGYYDLLSNIINMEYFTDPTFHPHPNLPLPSIEVINNFFITFNLTKIFLQNNSHDNDDDYNFWTQYYNNAYTVAVLSFETSKLPLSPNLVSVSMENVRNKQMADNLIWWLQSGTSHRKIIVWTHNMHFARNLITVNNTIEMMSCAYTEPCLLHTAGEWVQNILGTDIVYLLGATAFSGSSGYAPYYPVFNISAPVDSLEAYLNQSDLNPAGILDFRQKHRAPLPTWFSEARTTLAFENYTQFNANLWKNYDGVIFYTEQLPITPL